MDQQQNQNETHHTERQAVLSGLDAKIDGLDIAIASLIAEQHTMKRAREYVLSTHGVALDGSGNDDTSACLAPKLTMRPTYPSRSFPARKVQSSLRQEVLIRNAMDREKSSSPPGSVGLLSSVEFESSFPDHGVSRGNDGSSNKSHGSDNGGKGDVMLSIEGMSSSTAKKHSATSSATAANAFARSTTPSPASEISTDSSSSRKGQGAHWQAKRVTKRKLQANAAKAREVRRRKLKANSAAV